MVPAKRAGADRKLILSFNSRFGRREHLPPVRGFEFSSDLGHFDEARAVIFHIPSLGNIDRLEKAEGQIWVAWWRECDRHPKFSRLADPDFMSRFDLTMSYRLDADVVLPYFDVREYEHGERQLRAEPRPKKGLAALFLSGRMDVSGRTPYLIEVMKHMPVSSYGELLRTQRLPDDQGQPTMIETIAGFKFTLTFENAIAEDYVTEKLYNALYAGSVPVYLGAPNVDQFVPGDGCYIDVRDFAGPRELAERLLELDADEEAYQRYFDWKRTPFRPEFRRLIEVQEKHRIVRLCELIADRPDALPSRARQRPVRPSLQ